MSKEKKKEKKKEEKKKEEEVIHRKALYLSIVMNRPGSDIGKCVPSPEMCV